MEHKLANIETFGQPYGDEVPRSGASTSVRPNISLTNHHQEFESSSVEYQVSCSFPSVIFRVDISEDN